LIDSDPFIGSLPQVVMTHLLSSSVHSRYKLSYNKQNLPKTFLTFIEQCHFYTINNLPNSNAMKPIALGGNARRIDLNEGPGTKILFFLMSFR